MLQIASKHIYTLSRDPRSRISCSGVKIQRFDPVCQSLFGGYPFPHRGKKVTFWVKTRFRVKMNDIQKGSKVLQIASKHIYTLFRDPRTRISCSGVKIRRFYPVCQSSTFWYSLPLRGRLSSVAELIAPVCSTAARRAPGS